MLRRATVLEIKRLLDEGALSQTKIAGQIGVSRATVASIANGTRALYGRDDPAEADEPEDREYARCGGCGALVLPPCVACAARGYRTREQRFTRRAA